MLSSVGRPREHDEHTAEQLLVAAERLLGDDGAGSLTVRAVAAEVGVSVRAVYSLFESKEGLVDALVGRAFGMLADRADSVEISGNPPSDLVAVGLEGFRAFALEHPNLYRLTFEHEVGAAQGTPAWSGEAGRSLRVLRRRVEPLVGEEDVGDVTAQVHAICQGLASCEVNGVFRAMRAGEPERHWRAVLEAYVTGITGNGHDARRS